MIDVIPAILEKDWTEIERKIKLVAPLVGSIQVDFADNTIVPNATFLTIESFAPLIKNYPTVAFEAHLMVANPHKLTRPLVQTGFKRIIAHVESQDPRLFLDEAQYESVEVGIAIDGPTEIEQVEPFLEEVDFVLVMTIEAGFGGQPFLPETVEKIKAIHSNYPDLPIEVDGSINDATAKLVKDAGATRLVCGSFLFKDPAHIAAALEQIKNA
ncbi:hypothetical protein HY031_00835 [Candidatus Gottesmanbacteria bacterium]|nr:hypothetical protein [Candidatus Gottesmanbacteria bacterium]